MKIDMLVTDKALGVLEQTTIDARDIKSIRDWMGDHESPDLEVVAMFVRMALAVAIDGTYA